MNWFRKRKTAEPPKLNIPNSGELKLNVVSVDVEENITKHYVTFVSSELIFTKGVLGSVILGEVDKLETQDFDFETGFRANSLFRQTLFYFMQTEMSLDPSFIQGAVNQGDGYLHVIDQRTPTPQGRVPNYDILGAFKVTSGKLGAFEGNDVYRIRTENGFCDFGKSINAKLNQHLDYLVLQS